MVLKTVYIRFYRSFNYDYLRKNHPQAEAKAKPWDKIDNAFYPYVRVPIDEKVTTIVGANESGKSHLLSAIEKGISGKGLQSHDFCRYSRYFTVTKGEMRNPDFGFEWAGLSAAEKNAIREICPLDQSAPLESLLVFRTNSPHFNIFIPHSGGFYEFAIPEEKLGNLLPKTFRINAEVALPDSVPIRELARDVIGAGASQYEALSREERFSAIDGLREILKHPEWFGTQQATVAASPHLQSAFTSFAIAASKENKASQERQTMRELQIALARDLICKIAQVDQNGLKQLHTALRQGNDGHANGIIELINANLASRLNFPRVWVQDRDFALRVSAREHDLVFTIRDRTKTEYSFAERSSGLKYFLSYYIQYLIHESNGPDTEILLMDEPDAYLSSQAQQDLLKIFKAFSEPESPKRPVQVIYVTHSPFLIDKNNADRIRVLEKGNGDEGTRVVRNASRNHYEPLRSAFGAFVGETTFIGNCNLMVEGTSDQILLGGATAHLRLRHRQESETLDLNRITIVPAGSASHVPYLVFLARGRDVEKPPVIVLLDSDDAGSEAVSQLLKGGPKGTKQLLKKEYIVQVGMIEGVERLKTAFGARPIELEDFIPLTLCSEAVRRYAKQCWDLDEKIVASITPDSIAAKKESSGSVYSAIKDCVAALPSGPHIDKIGFARAVIELLPRITGDGQLPSGTAADIYKFEDNMVLLLTQLRKMQRAAEREQNDVRVSQKTERLKSGFLQDHPHDATREQAAFLVEDIESTLDDSSESDHARVELQKLKREFHLNEDIFQKIEQYEDFKRGLERVKYAGLIASKDA